PLHRHPRPGRRAPRRRGADTPEEGAPRAQMARLWRRLPVREAGRPARLGPAEARQTDPALADPPAGEEEADRLAARQLRRARGERDRVAARVGRADP